MQRVLTELTALGVALAALTSFLAMLHLLERAASRRLAHRLGWRAVLLTGWIGVPLHELSHLLAAWTFGHRIVAWKLFDPDPVTGTLGYVRHGMRRDTAWQRLGYLASGLAPAVVGLSTVLVLLRWMLPADALPALTARTEALRLAELTSAEVTRLGLALLALGHELGAAVWAGRSAWLPLQLYLLLAVGCHLAPSGADLRLAGKGLLAALLLLASFAAGLAALGLPAPGRSLLATLPVLAALVAAVALLQLAYVGLVMLATRRRGGGIQVQVGRSAPETGS